LQDRSSWRWTWAQVAPSQGHYGLCAEGCAAQKPLGALCSSSGAAWSPLSLPPPLSAPLVRPETSPCGWALRYLSAWLDRHRLWKARSVVQRARASKGHSAGHGKWKGPEEGVWLSSTWKLGLCFWEETTLLPCPGSLLLDRPSEHSRRGAEWMLNLIMSVSGQRGQDGAHMGHAKAPPLSMFARTPMPCTAASPR
jgi:hypothetical protein